MSVKKEAVGGEDAKKKSFISTRFLAANRK
jgi:hypothetical protein